MILPIYNKEYNIYLSDSGVAYKANKSRHYLKPLSTELRGKGYPTITLKVDGHNKHLKVHRLMAITFKLPRLEGQTEVDHINTIKTDNRLCNLRWVSPEENLSNIVSIMNWFAKVHCIVLRPYFAFHPPFLHIIKGEGQGHFV